MSRRSTPYKQHAPGARAWVRAYFDLNPEASVAQAARAANNSGAALPRPEIVRIHAEFLEDLRKAESMAIPDKAMEIRAEVIRKAKKRFYYENPDASNMDEEDAVVEEPEVIEAERVLPDEPPTPRDWLKEHAALPKRSDAAVKLRREWVNFQLDNDPGIAPQTLIGLAKELFGIALSWDYVYDCCRVAREIHGLPAIPSYPRHEPVEQVAAKPLLLPEVTEMPQPKVVHQTVEERLVSWVEPGRNSTETQVRILPKEEATALVIDLHARGIRPRVWKQVITKVIVELE